MTAMITDFLMSMIGLLVILGIVGMLVVLLFMLVWAITEGVYQCLRRVYSTIYVLDAIKHYKKIKPYNKNKE